MNRADSVFWNMVRAFLRKELSNVDEWEKSGSLPKDVIRRFGRQGLLGLNFPAEFGGGELALVDVALFVEEVAKYSGGVAVSLITTGIVGPLPLLEDPALAKEVLPEIFSGDRVICICLTEPNAGSDLKSISTRAKRVKNGFELNGRKALVTNGPIADWFLVLARLQDHDGPSLTLFLVPGSAEGLEQGPSLAKLGWHSSPTCDVVFERVVVNEDSRVGAIGEGLRIAMAGLNVGRVIIAARAVGVARAALEDSLAYSQTRIAFGRPIKEFQAIRFKLAEMATLIEAAESLVLRAAEAHDTGSIDRDQRRLASMAKWLAAEVVKKVTAQAIEVHGGYGFMEEYHVARYYRDAMVYNIAEGTAEMQKEAIAKGIGL